MEGMIHVQVKKGLGFPTLDFEKKQNPYVVVKLENQKQAVGRTDTVMNAGRDPEWTDASMNEIELFYQPQPNETEVPVTFEVFLEDFAEDEFFGIGKVDVSNVVKTKNAEPQQFTVALKDSTEGTVSRGKLEVNVWFGPPVRRAIRVAQKASKILQLRDHLVTSFCSLLMMVLNAQVWDKPKLFVKKHPTVCTMTAAALGVAAAAVAACVTIIAVPIGIFAVVTFPIWVIPVCITSVVTSPLWIPFVAFVVFLLSGALFLFVGFGLSSRPVRRTGAKLGAHIKQTELGKRVIYQKNE